MKFLSSFAIRPGCLPEAAKRFLAGQAQPEEGITLLGRWHRTDGSGGYSLVETNEPAKLYEFALRWSDVIEIHSHMVIDDAQGGAVIHKVFGK